MSAGWIGVDLDGTLAVHDGWGGVEHIGDPIRPMVARVTKWLSEGTEVRIMTARANGIGSEYQIELIKAWCLEHIGMVLPVTCCKDSKMIQLWDDRAIQVITNTGMPVERVRRRHD